MERKIVLKTGRHTIDVILKEAPLAKKIYNALPFESKAHIWGKEIYFEIPVSAGIEHPVNEVEKRDIAYWPEGRYLRLFFGSTPISKGENPIPASEVEVIGKVTSNYNEFEKVGPGDKITEETHLDAETDGQER